jgi:hypothetical protein
VSPAGAAGLAVAAFRMYFLTLAALAAMVAPILDYP